jgi:predicted CXXCH cytochrome family protein
MNRKQCGKVNFIFGGIVLLIAAFTAIAIADDKKEIPDHTGFQSCRGCHTEKQSQWEASGHSKAVSLSANNTPGATDCGSCHSSRSNEAKKQDTKTAGASSESFHKASCLACHSRQKSAFKHRLVVDPEKLCEACHTQRPIFWGLGAKGIEDMRNFHSGVVCVSCHMSEGNHKMKVLRPDDPGLTGKRLDTCTACHKDNNREARVRQLQEWQSGYDENMKPLLADAKAIDEALKKNPARLNTALRTKFNDAKANLALLEKDGSRGFHNFVFMLEITGNAAKDLKEIKAAVK